MSARSTDHSQENIGIFKMSDNSAQMIIHTSPSDELRAFFVWLSTFFRNPRPSGKSSSDDNSSVDMLRSISRNSASSDF